jgi:Dynamin family
VLPIEELQQSLQRTLGEAAVRLRAARFPNTVSEAMGELGRQVGEPCVLAVVGKVKAGKSSLINNLLGTNLAAVGTTETTATVNWFRYGKSDPDRPVRCVWRDAAPTSEPASFIAQLQGYSEETLKLASRIDRLEFRLDCELLQSVVVVDTPGLDADPDEHQNKTAEFLGVNPQLRAELRARHHGETQRLAQDADAVIYVFDPVVKGWEQATLEQFQRVIQKGTTTFNSLGVLGKIDAFLEDIESAPRFARDIERGLRDAVNTVVPVSAGLRHLADLLRREPDTLRQLVTLARSVPPETMELLLANDDLFVMELPDGLPTTEQRATLVKLMPWTVLQTVIKVMGRAAFSPDQCIGELERLSGFDGLLGILQRTFAARGRLLRSHRIVCEADRKLERDAYPFIAQCRELDHTDQDKRTRFLTYLQRLGKSSAERDKVVITEIREYVEASCGRVFREAEASGHVQDVRSKLSQLKRQFEVYSEDLVFLQTVAEQRHLFTPDEADELESLFGKHRLELRDRLSVANPTSYSRARQEHWRIQSPLGTNASHQQILEGAARRYGAILFELAKSPEIPLN